MKSAWCACVATAATSTGGAYRLGDDIDDASGVSVLEGDDDDVDSDRLELERDRDAASDRW